METRKFSLENGATGEKPAEDESPGSFEKIQQQISKGDIPAALVNLDALDPKKRATRDGLYLSAVCHRYLGSSDLCLKALDKLQQTAPDYGRGYQERGHLLKALGRELEALDAYRQACAFNPALIASWRGQLDLLRGRGLSTGKGYVAAQVKRLSELPQPLLAAADMLHEGKLLMSERVCRAFMQKNPRNVEGMRILAEIGVRFGVLDEAQFLLESAIAFDPDNVHIRVDLIQVLRDRQRFEKAFAETAKLLETKPENLQFQSLYAILCMQLGNFDSAIDYFDRIIEKAPSDPITFVSRGHALKTKGEVEKAVDSYREAYRLQPLHCESYYSLSNLKTYRFPDKELAYMQEMAGDNRVTGQNQVYLNFALGKAFEDRKEFDTAFTHYSSGNETKAKLVNYDSDDTTSQTRQQMDACNSKLFEKFRGAGCDAPDPIFIVGLPRAGSTLLEQILSSHTLVEGTAELPDILTLSGRLRRKGKRRGNKPYPFNLDDLDKTTIKRFGEDFMRDTRIHRKDTPFFIDKMPNNFRHIGLIKLILPNAKIIDARRHPMACCFSGFKQLFGEGQFFSYSLGDVGKYYKDYVALMDHWDKVLPDQVLLVQYEDVVADIDSQVRRILDYCNLPFEASCLSFYETERAVRTPSSEQVRQPLYKEGLEQWRHFEEHLGPLKAALGPVLERYPIS